MSHPFPKNRLLSASRSSMELHERWISGPLSLFPNSRSDSRKWWEATRRSFTSSMSWVAKLQGDEHAEWIFKAVKWVVAKLQGDKTGSFCRKMSGRKVTGSQIRIPVFHGTLWLDFCVSWSLQLKLSECLVDYWVVHTRQKDQHNGQWQVLMFLHLPFLLCTPAARRRILFFTGKFCGKFGRNLGIFSDPQKKLETSGKFRSILRKKLVRSSKWFRARIRSADMPLSHHRVRRQKLVVDNPPCRVASAQSPSRWAGLAWSFAWRVVCTCLSSGVLVGYRWGCRKWGV